MAGINPKLEFYRFKLNHKDGYKTFRDYAIDVWNVGKASREEKYFTRCFEEFMQNLNTGFDINEFTNNVMPEPELKEQFNEFISSYSEREGVELVDQFDISTPAVKKQARVFKNVIKLDKNFHIYVHGDNQYIKKGYDEATGMHYYQLFFKEEN